MNDSEKKIHMRGIRSFVLRQGRLDTGKKERLESLLTSFSPTFPIDAQGQTILEIGFGMGESFLDQATGAPNTHFIGAEVHAPGVLRVLERVEELGLTNVAVNHGDVQVLLSKLAPHSLDRVQILFPDPWPKSRHKKRRLIQTDLLKKLSKLLKPHGVIHIATDWQDYADHIQEVLLTVDELKICDAQPFNDFDAHQTKYAQRGLRLGHTISEFWLKTS